MSIKEDTIVKISAGMLSIMLTGLISLVAYLALTEFRVDANTTHIKTLEKKQDQMNAIQTDIAVIKTQITEINHRLGE